MQRAPGIADRMSAGLYKISNRQGRVPFYCMNEWSSADTARSGPWPTIQTLTTDGWLLQCLVDATRTSDDDDFVMGAVFVSPAGPDVLIVISDGSTIRL